MLCNITQVKSNNSAASSESSSLHGPSDYVFEIHCSETVYYVGVNPAAGASDGRRGVVCSMRSGTGLEQALSWETAIRQARLPLTTIPSTNEPSSSLSATTTASRQPNS